MARNPVQFQKGISLNAFLSLYGPDQCFDALYRRWRVCVPALWPPDAANSTAASSISASATASLDHRGNLRLPLTQAIDPGQERGLGLHRHLAAWRIRHKPDDREHPLSGWIQLDDAYLGGERSGGKRGRGAPGKTPFARRRGRDTRCTIVEGFRLTEIAELHLGGTRVVPMGWPAGVTAAGCVHEPVAAVERPEFRWVNTSATSRTPCAAPTPSLSDISRSSSIVSLRLA